MRRVGSLRIPASRGGGAALRRPARDAAAPRVPGRGGRRPDGPGPVRARRRLGAAARALPPAGPARGRGGRAALLRLAGHRGGRRPASRPRRGRWSARRSSPASTAGSSCSSPSSRAARGRRGCRCWPPRPVEPGRFPCPHLRQLRLRLLAAAARRARRARRRPQRARRTRSGGCPPSPGDDVQAYLDVLLRERLGVEAEVTHRWAGRIAYTDDRLPVFAELRPGVHGRRRALRARQRARLRRRARRDRPRARRAGGPARRAAGLTCDHGPNSIGIPPLIVSTARTGPCGGAPRRGRGRARRPPAGRRPPGPRGPRGAASRRISATVWRRWRWHHPRALVEAVGPRGEDVDARPRTSDPGARRRAPEDHVAVVAGDRVGGSGVGRRQRDVEDGEPAGRRDCAGSLAAWRATS